MRNIRNKVELVEFTSPDELYRKLEEVMCTNGELNGNKRFYYVQDIKLMDDSHALVSLEEDCSVIQVDFTFNGKKIKISENPYSEVFLPHQDIQLMNETGMVLLDGTEYAIEDLKYCIDKCGVHVEITLN